MRYPSQRRNCTPPRLNRRGGRCNPVAMNRVHILVFTALAAACSATLLTLSHPVDARLMDEPARAATALASIRMSDNARALAGVAVLVIQK